MKANEYYCPMVVSIMFYNLVLTVGFVDKISSAILSHGAIRFKYFSRI